MDNVKMFGRYAISIGVSYAVAKGWVTPSGSSAVTALLIEVGGAILALGPAAWAAIKVDNAPKQA